MANVVYLDYTFVLCVGDNYHKLRVYDTLDAQRGLIDERLKLECTRMRDILSGLRKHGIKLSPQGRATLIETMQMREDDSPSFTSEGDVVSYNDDADRYVVTKGRSTKTTRPRP